MIQPIDIEGVIQEARETRDRELKSLVGKTILSVEDKGSSGVLVTLHDGTRIHAYTGDSGTMRSPEPYACFSILPPRNK